MACAAVACAAVSRNKNLLWGDVIFNSLKMLYFDFDMLYGCFMVDRDRCFIRRYQIIFD